MHSLVAEIVTDSLLEPSLQVKTRMIFYMLFLLEAIYLYFTMNFSMELYKKGFIGLDF